MAGVNLDESQAPILASVPRIRIRDYLNDLGGSFADDNSFRQNDEVARQI